MLYEREGLAVRKIEFVDNQDCIGKYYCKYKKSKEEVTKSHINNQL
jgi:hypothetical protein